MTAWGSAPTKLTRSFNPKIPLDNHPPNALLFFSEKELMTTATQQIPSSPAQRLADKIRARTNNGRDLIDLLHNIAQGGYDASKSDRITASKFLFERGFGKCPRQTPATTPTPEPRDNNVGALREAPPAKSESPRLVTQVQDALNDSLGPAPGTTRLTPLSTNHYPIQSSIQGLHPQNHQRWRNPRGLPHGDCLRRR